MKKIDEIKTHDVIVNAYGCVSEVGGIIKRSEDSIVYFDLFQDFSDRLLKGLKKCVWTPKKDGGIVIDSKNLYKDESKNINFIGFSNNIEKLIKYKQTIDCVEGCLLDSLLFGDKNTEYIAFEHYVNPNCSDYAVFSQRLPSNDLDDLWNEFLDKTGF